VSTSVDTDFRIDIFNADTLNNEDVFTLHLDIYVDNYLVNYRFSCGADSCTVNPFTLPFLRTFDADLYLDNTTISGPNAAPAAQACKCNNFCVNNTVGDYCLCDGTNYYTRFNYNTRICVGPSSSISSSSAISWLLPVIVCVSVILLALIIFVAYRQKHKPDHSVPPPIFHHPPTTYNPTYREHRDPTALPTSLFGMSNLVDSESSRGLYDDEGLYAGSTHTDYSAAGSIGYGDPTAAVVEYGSESYQVPYEAPPQDGEPAYAEVSQYGVFVSPQSYDDSSASGELVYNSQGDIEHHDNPGELGRTERTASITYREGNVEYSIAMEHEVPARRNSLSVQQGTVAYSIPLEAEAQVNDVYAVAGAARSRANRSSPLEAEVQVNDVYAVAGAARFRANSVVREGAIDYSIPMETELQEDAIYANAGDAAPAPVNYGYTEIPADGVDLATYGVSLRDEHKYDELAFPEKRAFDFSPTDDVDTTL
jgi:hypothetical protein